MRVVLDVVYGERNRLGVQTPHRQGLLVRGLETAAPQPPAPGLAHSRALEACVGLTCSLCVCV